MSDGRKLLKLRVVFTEESNEEPLEVEAIEISVKPGAIILFDKEGIVSWIFNLNIVKSIETTDVADMLDLHEPENPN